ncbi:MAG: hypothetical protein CME99_04510 [Hyphomonas sp.]|nr:hypothetical protein [Hyphomonas sp.]OUX88416.1 MAG: hypothetical protein CBB91_04275 [Hyphomonas sp. TMED31]
MKRLIAMLTVGTLALAGCASGAGKAPVPPAPDVPIAGNLPAQDLEPGECGLFLWTQGDPRRFIYFSRAGASTAETMLAEAQQTLAMVRQGGSLFGQFMTEMDYIGPESESVFLKITPGETVEGGQKISSGRITLLNSGGWETVIPVSGLRACQPDTE